MNSISYDVDELSESIMGDFDLFEYGLPFHNSSSDGSGSSAFNMTIPETDLGIFGGGTGILGTGGAPSDTGTGRVTELNIPLNVFRVIVCAAGILGNLLVIFVILVLAEYRKAVTHWYVLQLAIADSLFLLTIPFRVAQDISDEWTFPVWMCKAKETILFLNYYSSILFLIVMSVDRYIAVCRGFSSFLQKFRTPFAAVVITVSVWVISLCMCIPVMLYSDKSGTEPNCKCQYEFPKPHDPVKICLSEGYKNGTAKFDGCVSLQKSFGVGPQCAKIGGRQPADSVYADAYNINLEDYANWDGNWMSEEEMTTRPADGDSKSEGGFLATGCHYYEHGKGFKAFLIFNFVVMFIVPLFVMSFCYTFIVIRLRSTNTRRQSLGTVTNSSTTGQHSGSGRKRSKSAASTRDNRNRIRVTIMCFCLVILFIICWLPFHSVHMAKIKGVEGTTSYCESLFTATSLLAYINSAVNPYLYNFIGTRFGRRIRQVKESKTARAFFSISSGNRKSETRRNYASSVADNLTTDKYRRTCANEKDKEVDKLVEETKPADENTISPTADLVNAFSVYTGPTDQRPPRFETLLREEPPLYQEQSNFTTESVTQMVEAQVKQQP